MFNNLESDRDEMCEYLTADFIEGDKLDQAHWGKLPWNQLFHMKAHSSVNIWTVLTFLMKKKEEDQQQTFNIWIFEQMSSA